MAASDHTLGLKIHEHLKMHKIENPVDFDVFGKATASEAEKLFEQVHNHFGLSTGHESTKETPKRLAKMYANEIFWGLDYSHFPKATQSPNDGKSDEIVLIRNIEVKSLCEHHWQPILGKAHIAYIPEKNLLGLSKFNRIVEFFARRPQLQERLCEQILHALSMILHTEDVAVIIEAEHFCVKFRGIEDQCSDTVTSRMYGRFMDNPALRAELMSLIRMNRG